MTVTLAGAVPASAAAVLPPPAPVVSSPEYPAQTWSGAAGVSGEFRFVTPPFSGATAFVYRLDDGTASRTVLIPSGGFGARATITPANEGARTLYVKSRNNANMYSPETRYEFGVGNGITEFGVMSESIPADKDMTTTEMRAKLEQACASATDVDNVVEGVAGYRAAASVQLYDADQDGGSLTKGTDEDALVEPADDSLYNEAWQQMTGGPAPENPTVEKPTTAPVAPSGSVTAAATADECGTATIQAQAAGFGTYDIKAQWREVDDATATLRWGYYVPAPPGGKEKGFGDEKITRKHNLTERIVKSVTKRPYRQWRVTGLKWNYNSVDIHHVRCTGWGFWRTCRSLERTVVRVSHDFRGLSDGKPFGIVTAYCTTYKGRCPSWVKNNVNMRG